MRNKRKIWEEAIRWFLWMKEHKVEATDIDVFNKWQSVNDLHANAYSEVESVWEMCDSIEDLPWPRQDELANDDYDGTYPISLPEIPASTVLSTTSHQLFGSNGVKNVKQTRSRFKKQVYSIAASVFLMLGTGLAVFSYTQLNSQNVELYETDIAEQDIYKLDDGSVITLGASSRVRVSFSDTHRQMELLQGEAYFEVAKDAKRPFIVDTGDASVVAVGTAFNINKRAKSVTISVLEGIVKVGKFSLKQNTLQEIEVFEDKLYQGQRVIFQPSGELQKTTDEQMLRATSWRQGNLAYVDERLDKVIEDLNRYSKTKLVIGDREIADFIFTGTVLNNDISDWLGGLIKTFPIRTLKLEDRIVLLSPLKSS